MEGSPCACKAGREAGSEKGEGEAAQKGEAPAASVVRSGKGYKSGGDDDKCKWIKGGAGGRKRLLEAVKFSLPDSYNFELEKTIQQIGRSGAKRVCLQFPEGLLCWADSIALIIEEFAPTVVDIFIIADVTYGACCVDDLKAISLRCDFLVHYAHSCLIPVDNVSIACLYVFVEIALSPQYLADSIAKNMSTIFGSLQDRPDCQPEDRAKDLITDRVSQSSEPQEPQLCDARATDIADKADRACQDTDANANTNAKTGRRTADESSNDRRAIALLGTIQFSAVLHATTELLRKRYNAELFEVPQCLPLTPGEVLGCTSPKLGGNITTCIFIADGRFHLESAMIQNPNVKFYRFDPFEQKLFAESYAREKMMRNRAHAIAEASKASCVYLVLSTLGRQGSVGLMEYTRRRILAARPGIAVHTLLISELQPETFARLHRAHACANPAAADGLAFVQVGCPRLSIDWGLEYGSFPILSPYEAYVAFEETSDAFTPLVQKLDAEYPMDYFATHGGVWTNYGRPNETRDGSLKPAPTKPSAERLRQKWLARRIQMQSA